MKYTIDFQHFDSASGRPIDNGEIIGIESDDLGFALIPNVGDYVQVETRRQGADFWGRVRSRLFKYINTGEYKDCIVNIVVENCDESVYPELVKR